MFSLVYLRLRLSPWQNTPSYPLSSPIRTIFDSVLLNKQWLCIRALAFLLQMIKLSLIPWSDEYAFLGEKKKYNLDAKLDRSLTFVNSRKAVNEILLSRAI